MYGHLSKQRFKVLLAALAALFVAAPLVREFSPSAAPTKYGFVVTVLFVGMLVSAVLVTARTRSTAKIAVLLAIPVVVCEIARSLSSHIVIDLTAQSLAICFLLFVVVVITKFLFVTDRVTGDTICAAVCVYLLLGVLWALGLSAVEVLDPGSFRTSVTGDRATIHFRGERSVDALYFSLVTLTTLGFGDITPSSPVAKMLVAMEAVIGQLFLTVLVARLVGLHITHSTSERGQQDR